MVVRGQFLDNAAADIGRVVDAISKDYAIVISTNPEPHFLCYGVRNVNTRVDEFLSSNLSKARFVAGELQKDLDQGYDRDRNETAAPSSESFPAGVPVYGKKAN